MDVKRRWRRWVRGVNQRLESVAEARRKSSRARQRLLARLAAATNWRERFAHRVASLPLVGGLLLQIGELASAFRKAWSEWDQRVFYALTIVAALASGFGIALAEKRNLPLVAAVTPVAPEARAFNEMVEATINGEKIGSAEYYTALKLTAGRRTLVSLLEQKALLQKAAHDHVTVSDAEVDAAIKALEASTEEPIEDANMRALMRQQERCRLLLRHMILPGVSAKEMHGIYDQYKPEITRYDVSLIIVGSREEADHALAALKHGDSFETLASVQSLDPATRHRHGHLGFCTRPTVARIYGAEPAAVLDKLALNQPSDPVACGRGWALLKVASVQSSYEQLKSDVEDLVVASRRTAFIRDLMAQATIRSRYLPSTVFAAPASHPSP